MTDAAAGIMVEPTALMSITACHSITGVITYPNRQWKKGEITDRTRYCPAA